MDIFWGWFDEQLERRPKEEAELLRSAAEQAVDAPPGMEPRESARLLQSKIGNQAMQRLLQFKEQQAKAQRKKQLESDTAAPVEPPTKNEIETTMTQAPAPDLSEVTEAPPPTQAQEAAAQKSEQAKKREEEKKAQQAPKPQPTVPLIEEQIALALRRFSATLADGGNAQAWAVLSTLFKEANKEARERVLNTLSHWVKALAQAPQRLFVEKLMHWRKGGGAEDLASQLWLRLRLLPLSAEVSPGNSGNTPGGGQGNGQGQGQGSGQGQNHGQGQGHGNNNAHPGA